MLPSLKLTAKAPENGWLEYFLVSFWGVVEAYFSGGEVLLVSGSVGLALFFMLTLSETNSSPLEKIDPWKRRFRTWKPPFLGAFAVSFREGKSPSPSAVQKGLVKSAIQ